MRSLRRRQGSVMPTRIVKGLDIPIAGAPEHALSDAAEVRSVALLGRDYVGLRPVLLVNTGDRVALGQPLFTDRRNDRIVFTSPGSGVIKEINRGARRALLSVVVELAGEEEHTFSSWPKDRLAGLRRDQVMEALLQSGLWTALRARPYSKVPDPDSEPSSIFVTAMDSNPLAAKAEVVIAAAEADFENGLTVISRLIDGSVFVCHAPRTRLPLGGQDNVQSVEFAGPHPAGLVGTHINFLDPVSAKKTVWHLGYQDVIAIGNLFTTGHLQVKRTISLAGPGVRRPRLIRTRLGAKTNDLVRGELHDLDCRIISGSVLTGRQPVGVESYLGRYHCQISVIAEAEQRSDAGWFGRRRGVFSVYRLSVTGRPIKRRFELTTAQHGRPAPMVPLGGYERVVPLDILPTPLLRALLVGDSDMAEALGCLELDEEDLALCSFVCPSKLDYASLLRSMLARIEKEG
jgi:Na+-transporting NADH:ubiquinone oxidoreductase subunit A